MSIFKEQTFFRLEINNGNLKKIKIKINIEKFRGSETKRVSLKSLITSCDYILYFIRFFSTKNF